MRKGGGIRERARKAKSIYTNIPNISTMAESASMKKVYEELKKIEENMITKNEIEALIDTIEIIGNPETLKQIADSMMDIKNGRVKEVNSVKDILSEL